MDDPTSRSRFRPEATSKPREISVTLHVNGEQRTLAVAPWTTLLDALRDRLSAPVDRVEALRKARRQPPLDLRLRALGERWCGDGANCKAGTGFFQE